MKRSWKLGLIVIAVVVLLACLVLLRMRSDDRNQLVGSSIPTASADPSFEVHVYMPRTARPFFGILPESLVKKLDGTPSEVWFNHTSSGARSGGVESNHLELKAEGWTLFMETDGEGRVAATTYLVFPISLGGRPVRLNCRAADPARGYLHATARAGAAKLDGNFLVELATCRNAESGKPIEWPPAPLTVRGNFAGLPPG